MWRETDRTEARQVQDTEWGGQQERGITTAGCVYSYIILSVSVCAAAVTEWREERAEGVHCGSLCGSDCPLLWESGNSTLLSRGLVTRWERRKEKGKKQSRKKGRECCIGVERETEMERWGRKDHENLGTRTGNREAENDQEMKTKIGRKGLREKINSQRERGSNFGFALSRLHTWMIKVELPWTNFKMYCSLSWLVTCGL